MGHFNRRGCIEKLLYVGEIVGKTRTGRQKKMYMENL